MRLTKSLLCGISALALTAGAAFAGQDSAAVSEESLAFGAEGIASETSPSELALEEGDVIYIFPMEVTEYYLVIPESQPLG